MSFKEKLKTGIQKTLEGPSIADYWLDKYARPHVDRLAEAMGKALLGKLEKKTGRNGEKIIYSDLPEDKDY